MSVELHAKEAAKSKRYLNDLRKLQKVAAEARRDNLVRVVHSENPPAVIMILGIADRRDAKAIATFVRTFTPKKVQELIADLMLKEGVDAEATEHSV